MEIKGRDIYKIRPIAHLQNKPYAVEETHPFYGQFYNTFQCNDKPFNVNTNDEFVKWRDNGSLFSATFDESTYEKEVDGEMKTFKSLRLLSCTNKDQEIAMAQTENILNKLYRDEEVSKVNDELLSALS